MEGTNEDSYIGLHVIDPTVGYRRLLGSLADACWTHVTKYCVVIIIIQLPYDQQ